MPLKRPHARGPTYPGATYPGATLEPRGARTHVRISLPGAANAPSGAAHPGPGHKIIDTEGALPASPCERQKGNPPI